MKKVFSIILILSVALFARERLTRIWGTSRKLKTVESVIFDRRNNLLYASCINGAPLEKNGKGYIAKLKVDGSIKKLKWIEGLNAPKGMGIVNNHLYVTDIDQFHEIDISTGTITATIDVPDAKFLNDIETTDDGIVVISDMYINSLLFFKESKMVKKINLDKYPGINGLFREKNILYGGTQKGIVSVDLHSYTFSLVIPHRGGIDGLKRFKPGLFLVSDWKGKVTVVGKTRKRIIMDTTGRRNAADFEYIPEKRLLIIPTFFDNRISAYRVMD